jgi:hypothetical protein
MRSVSYQRKVGDQFFPELLVRLLKSYRRLIYSSTTFDRLGPLACSRSELIGNYESQTVGRIPQTGDQSVGRLLSAQYNTKPEITPT